MRGFDVAVPYLRQLIGKYQIICVSEHWLYKNQLYKFDEVDERVKSISHASNRSPAEMYGCGRGQGGVGIFWDKSIGGITPIHDITHDRFCGIRLQNKNNTVINIFAVYMPASCSDDDLSSTLDELSSVLESREPESLNVICGDMNGDIGKLGGGRCVHPHTKAGLLVYNFCVRHDLWASNTSSLATGPIRTYLGHTSGSMLDYMLIPSIMKDDVKGCGVIEEQSLNTSDHLPVFVKIYFEHIPTLCTTVKSAATIKWAKLGNEIITEKYTTPLNNDVDSLIIESVGVNPRPEHIDSIINTLTLLIHKNADNLPKTKFRKHLKPYWCSEMNMLKRNKIRAYREWVDQDRPRDPGNWYRIEYIKTKRIFNRRLHALAREYETAEFTQTMKDAELNNSNFWRILKRNKGSNNDKVFAVKNKEDQIVHNLDEVLIIWREHFSSLCSPSDDPNSDSIHFKEVNDKVKDWTNLTDKDEFVKTDFSFKEVKDAVNSLNMGKAPGLDKVTAEHVRYGGEKIIELLQIIFSMMLKVEYVPKVLREGVQVPLHKGKNTSTTDPNNYRGITLLSTFCKIMEILFWKRMEKWWIGNISPMQGSGRKGVSCLHSALLVQETISSKLEMGKKVFVTYFDVAKAFDSVWINGLFYQLRAMGIYGTTWRMLYKMYEDFRCKVKVGDKFSEWYTMRTGIHQGGYLSSIKYVSFVNPLIQELIASKLCSVVSEIPTSPVGYADDLATASTAKCNVDMVMRIAHQHSCKWRYKFNAQKSAVMVHGESSNESKRNSALRQYRIGNDKVSERYNYDHVGVKSCLNGNFEARTCEKIKKGRRALNSVLSVGIKKKGINMCTSNMIFWSIIVPITLFGSELWVLHDPDLKELDMFQRQVGRKMQRFHKSSPVHTSIRALGWMRLETYIKQKRYCS